MVTRLKFLAVTAIVFGLAWKLTSLCDTRLYCDLGFDYHLLAYGGFGLFVIGLAITFWPTGQDQAPRQQPKDPYSDDSYRDQYNDQAYGHAMANEEYPGSARWTDYDGWLRDGDGNAIRYIGNKATGK